MNWPPSHGEMPDSNTAALRDHERKEDEGDLTRERLEAACRDADLRLDILDGIFNWKPGEVDPYDWYGFWQEHPFAYALAYLALAQVRPDLAPSDYPTDLGIRHQRAVRDLLDDFVEARLPRARELWIEEAERDGYLD